MTTNTLHSSRFSQLYINRLGLWLFILSESVIFVALLFTRFYLLGVERAPEINQTIGLIITGLLLVSSLTAYRAEVYIAQGNRKAFMNNILATILLGIVFLIGVGIEWSEAFDHFPPGTLFGTVFFTMTGMHAFHVLTGLLLLGLLYLRGTQGAYSKNDYWGAEATIKYWHFVDIVWVFFYPALYLLS